MDNTVLDFENPTFECYECGEYYYTSDSGSAHHYAPLDTSDTADGYDLDATMFHTDDTNP